MAGEIWIVAEHRRGVLLEITQELLAEGKKIAAKLGAPLCAVLLGHDVGHLAGPLAHYGAQKVYLADNPLLEAYSADAYIAFLSAAAREYCPELVLIGNTPMGRDLAPGLAANLGVGIAADCTFMEVDTAGELKATRPVFGGRAAAAVAFSFDRPRIATLRAGLAAALRPDSGRVAGVVRLEYPLWETQVRTRSLGIISGDPARIDLTEADVIVAGGRGMGSADNFRLLDRLAELLGGKVGGTRYAVDAGWISHTQQIGQTGKTVAPSLYIACGISGAVHHVLGIRDSKAIIAINKDRVAPIFKVADVGIVGDVLEVLPAIMKQVETIKTAVSR